MNLIRLGYNKRVVYAWSRTRMGGRAVAQSLILVYQEQNKLIAKTRSFNF